MPGRRCQRATNVAYYARNRDAEIRRVRDRQNATVAFLRDLRRVPCLDCGQRFEPYQMDFDHREPTTKSFWVTTGRASLMSRERLLAEIAKCDIVCANCHRMRTQIQQRERLAALGPSAAKSRYIAAARERWRAHGRLLDRLKDVPCADCRGQFRSCAMDFDHRDPTTKRSAVARLVSQSVDRILAEVAKCDIVCANCHRARTFRRREKQVA